MQVDYENVNPVTRAQRFSTWLKKTCLEAFVALMALRAIILPLRG